MYCSPKFGQLILTKLVATRCDILRPKCTQFDFGWGCAPDPTGGAYSTPPDPLGDGEGACCPPPRQEPYLPLLSLQASNLGPSSFDPLFSRIFFANLGMSENCAVLYSVSQLRTVECTYIRQTTFGVEARVGPDAIIE